VTRDLHSTAGTCRQRHLGHGQHDDEHQRDPQLNACASVQRRWNDSASAPWKWLCGRVSAKVVAGSRKDIARDEGEWTLW
jgi:hypothetical protein